MEGGETAVGQTSAENKRKGRPRVTVDDKMIAHLYLKEGLSTRDIAYKLGVSHQTIARRITEARLPTKKWRLPGES